MDDLVKVQVIHATSDPSGPIHKQPRSDFPACTQDFIELSMCTILHDDTVARGLSANSPVKGNTYPVRRESGQLQVPEQFSEVAAKGQESNLFTLPGQGSANSSPYCTGRGTLCTEGTQFVTICFL